MKQPTAVCTIALALGALILASRPGAHAQDWRQEGPIEIDKCQTISQPGSYKLVNNLTFNGPSGSACLLITASFVTIDLAGFTITGTSPVGPGPIPPPFPIAINAGDNTTGITVRNGSISGNFSDGVVLSGDGSIVEGLRVSNATALGITARGIVRGNTAVGIGAAGIDTNGLITGNYVSGAQSGIVAVGTVIGNTVTNAVERGIVVGCPSNVTDNTATGAAAGRNLVLNGTGCNDTNNVAP
jgi:hypothetical protein